MSIRALLACFGLLFVSGCLYHAREHTDATVAELVGHPYDAAPAQPTPVQTQPPKVPPVSGEKRSENPSPPQTDVQTTAYMAEAAVTELPPAEKPKFEPRVPPEVPGSEAPSFRLPEQQEAREARHRRIVSQPAASAG